MGGGAAARAPEEIVSERALLRWQSLIAGDFAKAYLFLSPSYRSAVSEAQYRSTFKWGIWKGASVKSVKCVESDICQVDMEIDYQIRAKLGGGVFPGKEVLHEVWRQDMGEWWNVPNAQ